MTQDVYRYAFAPHVPAEEAEATLLLALLGAESLHGEAQVLLDAGYCFDARRRSCVIDAGTAIGRDVNRLFAGFLRREFGDDSFTAERVEAGRAGRPSSATAPADAGAA
jgi:hypothetical protein